MVLPQSYRNEAELWVQLAGDVGVTMILMFDLPQEKEKRELGIKYLSQNKPTEQNKTLETS